MKIKITLRVCLLFFLSFSCWAYSQKNKPPVLDKASKIEEIKKMKGSAKFGSAEYEASLQKKYPGRMTTKQFEAWIKPLIDGAKNNKSENAGIITIPVVVHVIHSGEAIGTAPNITDAQIQSQISVLNNDFRRIAGTPGYNTNPLGADVMIQFALAKVDPNGNPTDGIDRVNMCQVDWGQPTVVEMYVKPSTIWDPTKYMNIWTVKFSLTNWEGYAQFPDANLPGLNPTGGLAETDGIVSKYDVFGSLDDDDGTFLLDDDNTGFYNMWGRTMTHEVGHFLGLRNTWGNDFESCETDYCADTPTAHNNSSCNLTIPSCDDPNVLEMTENYMAYPSEQANCQNTFTINQKERMMAVMNNSPRRMELKTSTAEQPIPLFANDAELKAEKSCNEETACDDLSPVNVRYQLYNRGTALLTSAVIEYSVNGGTTQTTNWTGSLAQNKFTIISIPTGTASGSVSAQITSVNGTSDQRATNNSASVNIGNTTYTANSNFTFELQRNYWGSDVTWNLTNSSGTVLYSGSDSYDDGISDGMNLPPLLTENWVLPLNDCYTFTITDNNEFFFKYFRGGYKIENSDGYIVAAGNHFEGSQHRTFNVIGTTASAKKADIKTKDILTIYPNPATDILYIAKTSDKAKFEIRSTLGQLIKSGTIKNNQVTVSDLLKGTYMIIISDNGVSENIKFIKK